MSVGVDMVDIRSGVSVYNRNPDRLYIPASAIKIFVSGITLIKVGAARTIQTPILYNGTIYNGALSGDICLKGMGDPSLTTRHLKIAAGKLKEQGILTVQGDLFYDTSLFDNEPTRFPPNARHLYSPPSALTINNNCVDLRIVDGPPPLLIPVPETSYVKLNYQIRISSGQAANIPRMTFTKKTWGDLYTIRGKVNQWNKRFKTMRLCVTRPGLFAATLFQEACQREGITFQGKIIPRCTPFQGKPLLKISGQPLVDAIRFLNSESNNVVAGNINKLLAVQSLPLPGTRAKGLAMIIDYCINELGYRKNQFIIRDASGLDRKNRLTPRQFTKALNHFHSKLGAQMLKVLPRQGNHPHARYPQPPEGIRAYVKSGTLPNTGVNSLVGYIEIKQTGQMFSFAILINRRGPGKPMYSGTYTKPILLEIFKALSQK